MDSRGLRVEEVKESDLGGFSRRGRLPEAIQELEKQMIKEAMARSGGNQRQASEILGITERMLGYRLKHYGFEVFRWKA